MKVERLCDDPYVPHTRSSLTVQGLLISQASVSCESEASQTWSSCSVNPLQKQGLEKEEWKGRDAGLGSRLYQQQSENISCGLSKKLNHGIVGEERWKE